MYTHDSYALSAQLNMMEAERDQLAELGLEGLGDWFGNGWRNVVSGVAYGLDLVTNQYNDGNMVAPAGLTGGVETYLSESGYRELKTQTVYANGKLKGNNLAFVNLLAQQLKLAYTNVLPQYEATNTWMAMTARYPDNVDKIWVTTHTNVGALATLYQKHYKRGRAEDDTRIAFGDLYGSLGEFQETQKAFATLSGVLRDIDFNLLKSHEEKLSKHSAELARLMDDPEDPVQVDRAKLKLLVTELKSIAATTEYISTLTLVANTAIQANNDTLALFQKKLTELDKK